MFFFQVSARTRAARELQRAAARLQKSELVRSVREMAGDAPEEIGIERWLAAKAHGLSARESGLMGASTVDDDDEELELMKRSLSKKERRGMQPHTDSRLYALATFIAAAVYTSCTHAMYLFASLHALPLRRLGMAIAAGLKACVGGASAWQLHVFSSYT